MARIFKGIVHSAKKTTVRAYGLRRAGHKPLELVRWFLSTQQGGRMSPDF